jgi:small subunit ribosomal protein S16
MAVKIRMVRIGRRHRPFFRINAIESRRPLKGRILEKLGHYDPIEKDQTKQLVLNIERVQYWLDKGAVPSETVSQILVREGIKHKQVDERKTRRAKARAQARAKGRFFTKAEKIAADKAAEEAKAKADAEAKAAEETKKAEAKAAEEAKKTEETKAAEEAKTEAEAEAATKEEKPAEEAKEETAAEEEAKE